MSEQSNGVPATTPPAAPVQFSPDGRWWWDGTRWVAAGARPVHTVAPGSAMPAYADPGGRASLATVMLALAGLAVIYNAIADLVQIIAVGLQGVSGPNDFRIDDLLQALAPLAYLVTLALAAVFFLRWEHRVSRNLRALGATGLRYTPGWAIGWWFVPIFNLFRPRDVVVEMWTATASDGITTPVPRYVRVWWGLWIAGIWLGYAGARFFASAHSTAGVLAGDLIDLVALVLLAVAVVLAIRLVGELTRRQQAAARQAFAYADPGTARPLA